jgi:hypothetical protein
MFRNGRTAICPACHCSHRRVPTLRTTGTAATAAAVTQIRHALEWAPGDGRWNFRWPRCSRALRQDALEWALRYLEHGEVSDSDQVVSGTKIIPQEGAVERSFVGSYDTSGVSTPLPSPLVASEYLPIFW